jgi:hypothetical protein
LWLLLGEGLRLLVTDGVRVLVSEGLRAAGRVGERDLVGVILTVGDGLRLRVTLSGRVAVRVIVWGRVDERNRLNGVAERFWSGLDEPQGQAPETAATLVCVQRHSVVAREMFSVVTRDSISNMHRMNVRLGPSPPVDWLPCTKYGNVLRWKMQLVIVRRDSIQMSPKASSHELSSRPKQYTSPLMRG